MFLLTSLQVRAVAGGKTEATTGEAVAVGSGIGSGVGASFVLEASGGTLAGVASSLGSTAAITVGGAMGAGFVSAGAAGYYVGSKLYDTLPTSLQMYLGERVASGLDALGSAVDTLWRLITKGK